MVFGAAFDGACSIWRVDTCTGKRMACERYDNATILYSLLAIALVVKATQVFHLSVNCTIHMQSRTGDRDAHCGVRLSPHLELAQQSEPSRARHSWQQQRYGSACLSQIAADMLSAGFENTEATNGPATFTIDDKIRPAYNEQPRVQKF